MQENQKTSRKSVTVFGDLMNRKSYNKNRSTIDAIHLIILVYSSAKCISEDCHRFYSKRTCWRIPATLF
jgi:hypothetical protein